MKPHAFRTPVPGGELECLSFGQPPSSAPTILFFHEGLGCAGLWRDFPAKLSQATGFGSIAVSRLGYGRSDGAPLPRPLDYMEQEAELIVPALVKALQVEEFGIYGHSDGGSIALLYGAGAHAPGLRAIVTEAAHVFCEELTLASIRKAREEYLAGELRAKLARHHGNNVDTAFWGWNRLWLDPAFATWDFTEKLSKIDVPLLSFQGDRDQYGTVSQLTVLAEKAGAKTALISGAAHSPHREKPEETLRLAADFFVEKFGGRTAAV